MADLLSALTHIHRRGIVHRDVKVENLLLAKDGRAVLTDFGIAALVSDEEAMGKCCGSPGYAAPEILCSKPYGIKVDSFSAGAVLFFMLCGKLPFEGKKLKAILKQTLTREVPFDDHPEFFKVTHHCKSFMLKLLEKDPENRLSAEQATSLWSINEVKDRGPSKRTNQYTQSTEGKHISPNISNVGNMAENTFNDHFMTSGQQTPRGGSAFRFLRPQSSRNKADGAEDNLDKPFDRDFLTDSCSQRNSFRCSWNKMVNQLMPKRRINKTKGPSLQSVNRDVDGEIAMGSQIYRTCDQNPKADPNKNSVSDFLSSDLSDSQNVTELAEDHGRVSHPSSSSCGSPADSYAVQGNTQQLVSVSALASLREPIPPTARPEDQSPNARSFFRRTSRICNKGHECRMPVCSQHDLDNPFISPCPE